MKAEYSPDRHLKFLGRLHSLCDSCKKAFDEHKIRQETSDATEFFKRVAYSLLDSIRRCLSFFLVKDSLRKFKGDEYEDVKSHNYAFVAYVSIVFIISKIEIMSGISPRDTDELINLCRLEMEPERNAVRRRKLISLVQMHTSFKETFVSALNVLPSLHEKGLSSKLSHMVRESRILHIGDSSGRLLALYNHIFDNFLNEDDLGLGRLFIH